MGPGEPVERVVGHDLPDLAGRLARHVRSVAQRAVRQRGAFRLVLSGGSTPRALYQRLARWGPDEFPWHRTWVYWGDERLVPPDHPDSNFGMARSTLLSLVPLPAGQIARIRGEDRPASRAAATYARLLGALRDGTDPVFDLTLLGIGPDGHTASLFPGQPTLREPSRWVVGVPHAGQPPHVPRVTLTLPALHASREVCFLVAGKEKAEVLRSLWRALPEGSARYPASLVMAGGSSRVYMDAAAASLLPPSTRRTG